MSASARTALLALLGLSLVACTGFGPPPRDHYYRLPQVPSESRVTGDAAVVVVPPFAANGVHGERPLVFAHADGVTLEQYHYHLWVDSPRLLLQTHLQQTLATRWGVRAVAEPQAAAPLVRGTIVRLERTRRTGGDDTADVALQLAFHAAGERVPLLAREYARSVPLAADDMSACVAALGKAVEDIFAEWMADLGAAWQP